MNFSEQWLRSLVNPQASRDELVARLSMAGLEVDGVAPVAGEFSGVVVGEILSAEQHPDADKLRVCQVSDGEQTVQIVCGAPNARVGIKIPFARVGAVLPGDFKIKKAKLRGVESFGMLCSASELQISEENDGLLELPADVVVGQCVREALNLNDVCIEVDLTPNRGDCLSLQGLAREVGALYNVPVQLPAITAVPASHNETVKVELRASEACPRYVGRVIKGVDLSQATPAWMVERLQRSDIRSIDPVVDVTNYVMIELGQPLHAFDLAQIKGGICVRMAQDNEQITLLDGQEIKLKANTLVIADQERALAIAGVMGGENSGVEVGKTTDIFLESAFFDTIALAGKARSYGLHTDSSHRFERGVDSQLAREAMERATALLLEIVGGEAGPIIEVACIFVGIFLTMIPALKFLGQVAPTLPLNDVTFFSFSGLLSSVLDNAPTYATFFEMARVLGESTQGVPLVAGVPESYLVAISLGAVFCGALTYIGNGPNFMVKAVAERADVEMPSFGGYVVKSFTFLAPVLVAMMCLFIAEPLWAKAIGAVITLFLVGRSVYFLRVHRADADAQG